MRGERVAGEVILHDEQLFGCSGLGRRPRRLPCGFDLRRSIRRRRHDIGRGCDDVRPHDRLGRIQSGGQLRPEDEQDETNRKDDDGLTIHYGEKSEVKGRLEQRRIGSAPDHNQSPPRDGNGRGGVRQDRNPCRLREFELPQSHIENRWARIDIRGPSARRPRSTLARLRLGRIADRGSAVVERDSRCLGVERTSFFPIKTGFFQGTEIITLHIGIAFPDD